MINKVSEYFSMARDVNLIIDGVMSDNDLKNHVTLEILMVIFSNRGLESFKGMFDTLDPMLNKLEKLNEKQ